MTSRWIRSALLPALAGGLLLSVAACDETDRNRTNTNTGVGDRTTRTTPDVTTPADRPGGGLTGEPTGPTNRSGTDSTGGRTGTGLGSPDIERDTGSGVTDGPGSTTQPSQQNSSEGSGPQGTPDATQNDNLGGTPDSIR
jgi:hypothetical protein